MKPCPDMDPRLPDDDRHPKGMMESNRDFAGHNSDWLEWCEKNHKAISLLPDMLKALKEVGPLIEMAFKAEGDVFGVHHNNAVDTMNRVQNLVNSAKET
jgi:hypothetical protein